MNLNLVKNKQLDLYPVLHCRLNKDAGNDDPMVPDDCEQDLKAHDLAKGKAKEITGSLLQGYCHYHPEMCY